MMGTIGYKAMKNRDEPEVKIQEWRFRGIGVAKRGGANPAFPGNCGTVNK